MAYDATIGRYDAYILCNNAEQLSWALQHQHIQSNNDSALCSSAGGMIQQPPPKESQPSDCQELLRQVGPNGTGKITFTSAFRHLMAVPLGIAGCHTVMEVAEQRKHLPPPVYTRESVFGLRRNFEE